MTPQTPQTLDRLRKESVALFDNPRTARQAWRSVGAAILASPATLPPEQYDADGNPTYETLVARYSYDQLSRDVATLSHCEGAPRQPTQLELIFACQAVHAMHNTAAAAFIRDTMGARPVDETKLDATLSNPYDTLSDEELLLLEQHRQEHGAAAPSAPSELSEPHSTL